MLPMELNTLIQKAQNALSTGQERLAETYMGAALQRLDAQSLGVWL